MHVEEKFVGNESGQPTKVATMLGNFPSVELSVDMVIEPVPSNTPHCNALGAGVGADTGGAGVGVGAGGGRETTGTDTGVDVAVTGAGLPVVDVAVVVPLPRCLELLPVDTLAFAARVVEVTVLVVRELGEIAVDDAAATGAPATVAVVPLDATGGVDDAAS